MKKKIVLLLSLVLCVSCGGPSTPKSEKQILHVNFTSEPPTIDPRKGGDWVSSTIQFMLFEGLTRMAPGTNVEPAIAERIEISDDMKTYTFYLRETYWSDGTPVTATDFEHAWKDMLDPQFPCPNANLLYPIKNSEAAKKGEVTRDEIGLHAPDSQTFVVELETPTPYFLDLTSFCVFFPVPYHIVSKHPGWADNAGELFISNGPFKLTKWHHHNELIVEKNPTYWDAEEVKLSGVHISLIDDESTALSMFENGTLDVMGFPFTDIPIDSLPTLIKQNKILTEPVGATTMCSFNVNEFPFTNKNIRKAFALAINRQEIVDNITQLGETVATGTVPPILKNNVNNEYFKDHDIESAQLYLQKGLDELGITADELPEIKMQYIANDLPRKIAQAVQQQWFKALNIHVKIEQAEFKVFLDKLVKKDFQIGQFAWVAQYNDQMNILDRFKFKNNPKNYPGWENQDYIKLLDESMHHADKAKRLTILEEAEAIFIDEMPITSIFHWNFVYMKNPQYKGLFISPIGSIHLGKSYFE